MDEKTMVSDALVGINGELKMYAEYITQSENPQLKQTLKQMRNKAETAQEQRKRKVLLCTGFQSDEGRGGACEIPV